MSMRKRFVGFTIITIALLAITTQTFVMSYGLSSDTSKDTFDVKLKPVGTAGMDWTLEDIMADSQITFSNYEGKIVLLDFFTISCPACITSMSDMKEIRSTFSTSKLVIISVDVAPGEDSEIEIEDFAEEYEMNWKIVRDTAGLSTFYEIAYIPTYYLFDQDQNVYSSSTSISASVIISKVNDLLPDPTTSPSTSEPLGFFAKNWYWFAILAVIIVVSASVFIQRRRVIEHNKRIREEKSKRKKDYRRKQRKFH